MRLGWWIIVSVSDTGEMMGKSSGNGFSVGLGLTNECNLAVLIAIAIQVGSIVCPSMTFGAFVKMCRFDR